MRKIQAEVRKFISQFDFLKTSYKYDVILMFIYPIYILLNMIGIEFAYSLTKFSAVFLVLYLAGIILSLANNKIKEIAVACGVMFILSVVDFFNGYVDSIIYSIIYGAVTYCCYKLFKENEVTVHTENVTNVGTSANEKTTNAEVPKAETPAPEISATDNGKTIHTNENTNVNNGAQAVQLGFSSINIVGIWQPLVSAIIIMFALFQDWIKLQIEEFGMKSTYSISNIKNLADGINRLADFCGVEDSVLTGMTVFINILHYSLYVVLIAEILFIITKIIDNEKYKVCGTLGSMITIIITAVIFIIKAYVGAQLKNELSIDVTILTTTIFPIIAAAASIWQLASMGHKGSVSSYGLQVLGKKCRVCGTMNHEEADKCGKCGSALSSIDIVYKK